MTVKPVSVRPETESELAEWRAEAEREGLSLSSWLRRCARKVIDVRRAVERADQEAARRAQRLGHLTPPEVDRLRARGDDWDSWPELDEQGDAA